MNNFTPWQKVLILVISVLTFASCFAITVMALDGARALLGLQENAWSAWLCVLASLRAYRVSKKIPQVWLAAGLCNLIAYTAWRMHNEPARRVFSFVGDALILLNFFMGTKWWKKLKGLVKSAGLTLVNAASFKRQSKEAFQCTY